MRQTFRPVAILSTLAVAARACSCVTSTVHGGAFAVRSTGSVSFVPEFGAAETDSGSASCV